MYSGKSCCCDCGDKFCKGTEYFYDNTSIGCPVCAVGISSMAGGTFAWPGTEPKHKMPISDPDPWDGDDLFIGEPCWSSDVCEDYHECVDDMFPPHYYQLLSPMGPLPWTPQAFEDWIENYHGPLVPKGDCTMHCTEENIGCHKIAFVGALGYQDGIGADNPHLTIPPYPSSTENVYDNCENWKWIRNWVIDGGKLVIMIDPTYGSWHNSWCLDQDSGKDLGCWLDCVEYSDDCLCDCGWPSSENEVTDVVEEDFRRFAHFCATSEEEWQAGCEAHDEHGCINIPIGDGPFNIVPETEFYHSSVNYMEDYMNLPEDLTPDDEYINFNIPCCQQTIKPFVKAGEDSGGNSTGNLPLSFRTNEAAPLYPVNEGVGVVGSCGKSGQHSNPWPNACTVAYKQHGKGAVIVIYDYTVWGTYQMNSSVFPPRDDFDNGLNEEDNKLMACNNDFWTFLCQDFLIEEGYSPSSCAEPMFWDNKGPDYEGNECLPKAACCKSDGTCADLNVWECEKDPLSTYHGWQAKSGCLPDSCTGCDGEGGGSSCNTCADIGGCEEMKMGACCHCEDGSCPEPSDDDGEQPFEYCEQLFGNICEEDEEKCCYSGQCVPLSMSCDDIYYDDAICWPKQQECSPYKSCNTNWPFCTNDDCCEFICRGWVFNSGGPDQTLEKMQIPDGINPQFQEHIGWMKILCEDGGELLYNDDNILIGITWDGGDEALGKQIYGVLEREPCDYYSGGFSHKYPWPGWTGDYENISWGEIKDDPMEQDSRARAPIYTCGYWSSWNKTCKPPEEHPDWNTVTHGHAPMSKYVDGVMVPCNGVDFVDNEYIFQPPCG